MSLSLSIELNKDEKYEREGFEQVGKLMLSKTALDQLVSGAIKKQNKDMQMLVLGLCGSD